MEDYEIHVGKLVSPVLESIGLMLFRVRVSDEKEPTLQVMIERPDGVGISINDCARASRLISTLLDANDLFKEAYTLEVSSPGIDRPLVNSSDFERFTGYEVKLELRNPISGRRRFRGRLLGVADEVIRLSTRTGETELPICEIEKAKLNWTDDLLATELTRVTE